MGNLKDFIKDFQYDDGKQIRKDLFDKNSLYHIRIDRFQWFRVLGF